MCNFTTRLKIFTFYLKCLIAEIKIQIHGPIFFLFLFKVENDFGHKYLFCLLALTPTVIWLIQPNHKMEMTISLFQRVTKLSVIFIYPETQCTSSGKMLSKSNLGFYSFQKSLAIVKRLRHRPS